MFEPLENRETEALAEFGEYIRKAVDKARKAELGMVEQACEEAIQGGKYGVFVLKNSQGGLVSAVVHEHVPYGHIYYGVSEPPFPPTS